MERTAVIACGDRHWNNRSKILVRLNKLPKGTVVINGLAEGADKQAREVARSLSLPTVDVEYFRWLGRAGGPARNRLMLDLLLALQVCGYDVRVIAFHRDIESSKGTANMLKLAGRAGVACEVIS